ncbi:hypothetical protein B0H11DRAFT_1923956 [Mycena galericulata]|nr:hypothetical protein B0H11DRAFT_1923941 [Mycena galericulata]KAJ7460356.1 hypothetical protein B0H11DRAFT_1923956 [Mycena galericulata]
MACAKFQMFFWISQQHRSAWHNISSGLNFVKSVPAAQGTQANVDEVSEILAYSMIRRIRSIRSSIVLADDRLAPDRNRSQYWTQMKIRTVKKPRYEHVPDGDDSRAQSNRSSNLRYTAGWSPQCAKDQKYRRTGEGDTQNE